MSTSTILRQVEMLRFIPTEPRSESTKEIYSYLCSLGFDVSKRTIERDLMRISEPLGLDYKTEQDGNHWYYMRTGKQPMPNLSANEALLLMQAKALLAHVMPTKSLLTLEPKFEKAESTLNNNPKHKKWPHKIAIAKSVNLEQTYIAEEFREIINDAVLNEQQLKIVFVRNNGETIEITVNAYGLIIKEHMQYLVASYATAPNELRLIKLPKVLAVEATLKSNQLCTENIEKFLQSNAASYRLADEPIKVKMNVAGPALQLLENSKLSSDQNIEYFEGHEGKPCGLLTATTDLTHDFVHFILGYGKWVQVLEPQVLIEEVALRQTGKVF